MQFFWRLLERPLTSQRQASRQVCARLARQWIHVLRQYFGGLPEFRLFSTCWWYSDPEVYVLLSTCSRSSFVYSHLEFFLISSSSLYLRGYGRRCDHAATSCLANSEGASDSIIAGVGGHSSSQQRRALFQRSMAAMSGFWPFFGHFSLLQVVWS